MELSPQKLEWYVPVFYDFRDMWKLWNFRKVFFFLLFLFLKVDESYSSSTQAMIQWHSDPLSFVNSM